MNLLAPYLPLVLRDRATRDLSADENRDLATILGGAVEPLSTPDEIVAGYARRVRRVLIAYAGGEPTACQYYQILDDLPGAPPVLHMSLAARRRDSRVRSVNRRMGRHLFLKAAWRAPFAHLAVAARIESPIAYRNLLRLGGAVFPDVRLPDPSVPAPGLYLRIAERLGLSGLDPSTGRLPFRPEAVGFRHAPDAYRPDHADPIGRAFLDHLGRGGAAGSDHSLFVVTITSAARAAFAAATGAFTERPPPRRPAAPPWSIL